MAQSRVSWAAELPVCGVGPTATGPHAGVLFHCGNGGCRTDQARGEHMYSKQCRLHNQAGLHARPAAEFVFLARTFTARIKVRNPVTGQEVDAKSIARVLGLGLDNGQDLLITARGSDEQQAVNSLVQLIDNGFEEG